MNLHAIAAPFVGVVNPRVVGDAWISTGYSTGANGKREPKYDKRLGVDMQVQSLTNPELRLMEGLNIAGNMRAVYLFGGYTALSRADKSGGDLLRFEGKWWLTIQVLEYWPDWCKVAVVEQMNGP